ncbi:MAG: hypothetical protein AB2693_32365 [Candidatus Thiodiazotropha sp.]
MRRSGGPRGRVVKVSDFSAFNHSIISPLWFEPTSDHMWDKPSSAFGWPGGFPGVLPFRPTY